MLPRTWLLHKWQKPPWCWNGKAPWPNWTPSDWFMYLLMATGQRRWSQAALSPIPWGVLHLACCTPSASLPRGAAGPVHLPPSQHRQVRTATNTHPQKQCSRLSHSARVKWKKEEAYCVDLKHWHFRYLLYYYPDNISGIGHSLPNLSPPLILNSHSQ